MNVMILKTYTNKRIHSIFIYNVFLSYTNMRVVLNINILFEVFVRLKEQKK